MLGSLPFVLMLLGMVFILAVFPDVALWLPQIFG